MASGRHGEPETWSNWGRSIHGPIWVAFGLLVSVRIRQGTLRMKCCGDKPPNRIIIDDYISFAVKRETYLYCDANGSAHSWPGIWAKCDSRL